MPHPPRRSSSTDRPRGGGSPKRSPSNSRPKSNPKGRGRDMKKKRGGRNRGASKASQKGRSPSPAFTVSDVPRSDSGNSAAEEQGPATAREAIRAKLDRKTKQAEGKRKREQLAYNAACHRRMVDMDARIPREYYDLLRQEFPDLVIINRPDVEKRFSQHPHCRADRAMCEAWAIKEAAPRPSPEHGIPKTLVVDVGGNPSRHLKCGRSPYVWTLCPNAIPGDDERHRRLHPADSACGCTLQKFMGLRGHVSDDFPMGGCQRCGGITGCVEKMTGKAYGEEEVNVVLLFVDSSYYVPPPELAESVRKWKDLVTSVYTVHHPFERPDQGPDEGKWHVTDRGPEYSWAAFEHEGKRWVEAHAGEGHYSHPAPDWENAEYLVYAHHREGEFILRGTQVRRFGATVIRRFTRTTHQVPPLRPATRERVVLECSSAQWAPQEEEKKEEDDQGQEDEEKGDAPDGAGSIPAAPGQDNLPAPVDPMSLHPRTCSIAIGRDEPDYPSAPRAPPVSGIPSYAKLTRANPSEESGKEDVVAQAHPYVRRKPPQGYSTSADGQWFTPCSSTGRNLPVSVVCEVAMRFQSFRRAAPVTPAMLTFAYKKLPTELKDVDPAYIHTLCHVALTWGLDEILASSREHMPPLVAFLAVTVDRLLANPFDIDTAEAARTRNFQRGLAVLVSIVSAVIWFFRPGPMGWIMLLVVSLALAMLAYALDYKYGGPPHHVRANPSAAERRARATHELRGTGGVATMRFD